MLILSAQFELIHLTYNDQAGSNLSRLDSRHYFRFAQNLIFRSSRCRSDPPTV